MNLTEPDTGGRLLALVALAVFLSWNFSWLATRVATRYKYLDYPDGKRKLHQQPVPLMGGVAIFLAAILSLLAGVWLFNLPVLLTSSQWLGLGLTSGALCGLGLYDDLFHLRPKFKLLWQSVAILPFLALFPVAESVQILGWPIQLGAAGILFTGLFLVAALNALNFIDGVDGLATSVCMVIFVAAAIHALLTGTTDIAVVLFIVTGCSAGFLIHNWAPARLYLGDSGSHLLGFWAGAFALISSTKTVTGLTLSVPVVLLSLPAFDTALAILRRILIRRSIAEPDRLHLHHRLLLKGFSPAKVTLLITGLSGMMAAFALGGSYFRLEEISWGGCGLLLGASILFKLCGEEELKLVQQWWKGTLEPVVTEEEKEKQQPQQAVPIPLARARSAQAETEKRVA